MVNARKCAKEGVGGDRESKRKSNTTHRNLQRCQKQQEELEIMRDRLTETDKQTDKYIENRQKTDAWKDS